MAAYDHNEERLNKILDELNRPFKISDIPRRIALFRKALQMLPKSAPPRLWGALQNNLALSLVESPLGSRADNVENALEHYHLALQVRTPQSDRVRWALTQDNLAGAYLRRVRGDRAENLEQALRHSQCALEVLTPISHPVDWAKAQNTLGEICRVRIGVSRSQSVETAIEHFMQALEVFTRHGSAEEQGMVLNNLGNAYLARIRDDRAQNVETAIKYCEQGLRVRTRERNPLGWAAIQNNLGNAYLQRIYGDPVENIEQAIYHLQLSLEERTLETCPEGWGETQNNLGNAWLARVRRGEGDKDGEDNIERAIEQYMEALQVRTRDALPLEWAETQNNLGIAFTAWLAGERAENIEKAIEHYENALQVRKRDELPEEWAETLNNLAGAFTNRLRGDLAENIERAIGCLQDALTVRVRADVPEDWAEIQNNLAIAYTDRQRGDRVENVELAINHYRQALEVYTYKAFPDRCLKSARALANLAFEEKRWQTATHAYDTAFLAQGLLMQASFSRAGKQIELGGVQNLSPRAAYSHVKCGQPQRAVEVMEQGRAQLLRESLEKQRQDLEELPRLGFERQYRDYLQAVELYDALQNRDGNTKGARPPDWISKMERAQARVERAITTIRGTAGQKHPQYRRFLQPLSFDEIQERAEEVSLVYLTATSAGGLALIVNRQAVDAVELPALEQEALYKQIWSPSDQEVEEINRHLKSGMITEKDIQAVSGGYFSAYALWSLTSYLTGPSKDLQPQLFDVLQASLDRITRWLWEAGVGELVTRLKQGGKGCTFIPAGQLGFLPLHAAWTENNSTSTGRRYALDEVSISYAPSVHALREAQQAADRPTEKLMVVDNPDGSLFFSHDEVRAALSGFEKSHCQHLRGKDAMLARVREQMQSAHVLHFSTHGRAGWEKADQALLKLTDGNLTLPDIFALNLRQARLAVLSACETGIPGLELIDEMVGLPAGMMQAGVPGVVGSLWSVNDMSTAMLMAQFYSLWRHEKHPPREALRLAQIWLRDSTAAQKKEFFHAIAYGKVFGLALDIATSFYRHLSLVETVEADFSSPYYWAAFTYTGI